jgi:sugar transferase (PEP-CTERM/EpsH1 system associated)
MAGVRLCVHGEHGWNFADLRGETLRQRWLRRLHSPFVDTYVAVSNDLVRYLVDQIGIAPERIVHICNGVDVERFAPATAISTEILPPHMRGNDVLVVGTVGRIQAVKDQGTLIRAFATLCGSDETLRRNLRLAIVGDGPLLGSLRAIAETLGVADACWFPGAMANIPEVLRAFDVFVLPSLNEGISNTILEAMATGLPVVATAVGGNVEIVDPEWGRLFEPGDTDTLARLLGDYLYNSALRASHGAAARRAARDRFSIMRMVEAYRSVYASLLRGERICRA